MNARAKSTFSCDIARAVSQGSGSRLWAPEAFQCPNPRTSTTIHAHPGACVYVTVAGKSRCGAKLSERMKLLHTREVAGSKPAAPIRASRILQSHAVKQTAVTGWEVRRSRRERLAPTGPSRQVHARGPSRRRTWSPCHRGRGTGPRSSSESAQVPGRLSCRVLGDG